VQVLSLTQQQSRVIQSSATWQAEGVHARSLRNLAGLDLRLLEVAPAGELTSPAISSDRCYYVLAGSGVIGKPGAAGEPFALGNVAALTQGESFFIRNIGDGPLQVLFIRGAEEGTIAKETLPPAQPAAKKQPAAAKAGAVIPNDSFRCMIWFDGGSTGNPGPSYGSYAIFVPDAGGNWPSEPAQVIGRLDFGRGTNNEAEYKALLAGLEDVTQRIEAAGQPVAKWQIEVRGDSDLVIKQVGGEWQVKKDTLRPLTDRAQTLLRRFGKRDLKWHSRTNSVRVLGH